MPDIKGNNQKIYDYLSSSNVKGIGENADQFSAFMKKDDNRRKVYDYLSSKKVKGIGGSYEEFSSLVYDGGASSFDYSGKGGIQDAISTGNWNAMAPQPAPPLTESAPAGAMQQTAQKAAPAPAPAQEAPAAETAPAEQPERKVGMRRLADQYRRRLEEEGENMTPEERSDLEKAIYMYDRFAEGDEKVAAMSEREKYDYYSSYARSLESKYGDLIGEYERRLKMNDRNLPPKELAENYQWLHEHEGEYKEAKRLIDGARGKMAATGVVDDAKSEVEKAKEANDQAISDLSPLVAFSFRPGLGGTMIMSEHGQKAQDELAYFNSANTILGKTDQILDQGSKYDPGYNGDWYEQAWTAARQFVGGAINNIDEGTFTMGLSDGLAFRNARKAGEHQNEVINKTMKDLGYDDAKVEALISSVEEAGKKMAPLVDELNAAAAEIETMNSTYEDMVSRGESRSKIEAYAKEINAKVEAYNKRLNDEYEPLRSKYEEYDGLMSAIDAAVKGELTGGEQAIVDALEKYTNAQVLRAKDVSTASKAGAGAEQSAEFMLDFFLTGGMSKAGTKAATKIATRRMMKKFGREAVEKQGLKFATKTLEREIVEAAGKRELARRALVGNVVKPGIGLQMATDAVVSAARTAVMVPRNLQTYGEYLIETNPEEFKDATGRIQFSRSRENAALNTALTQYIEYWSEGFGEYFGAGEQYLFRKVTGAAPRTAIGQTLKGLRGSVGQYLDYGKFDGMLNEMLEEVVGSGFNALAGWMSGDRVGDKDAMKEFWAGENLATLSLSFLPMTAISTATNMRAYTKMKDRYDKAVAGLNGFIESGAVSRKDLEDLSRRLPEMTPVEVKDKIVEMTDKARKANHGSLPSDFTQNILGYLEGSFAMSMRNEQWEDSQEKMALVNAYTATYAAPNSMMAWDLSQREKETKQAAVDAGFTEDELGRDSYTLGQEAVAMKAEDADRAGILMDYAAAKASMDGLADGYNEETKRWGDEYDANIRRNVDTNGRVITANLSIDGKETQVFVVSDAAGVSADGTVTSPTGPDGLLFYMVGEKGEMKGAKAKEFSGASSMQTDEFVAGVRGMYEQERARVFDERERTMSVAGQARALSGRIGGTVYVRGNGAFEPVRVERMRNTEEGGMNVVISGDKKALQNIAALAGMQSPGGRMLEIPVDRLYPLLATEEDGSLTTDMPEANGTPAEGGAAPVAETTATTQDYAGTTQTIDIDGRPTEVYVDQVNGDGVWYNYETEDGDTRSGVMPLSEFQQRIVAGEAPAAEAETPAPAPAPAPAPVESSRTSAFPVDEKGNKVYDHPSVTPAAAYAELYGGVAQGSKDEANRGRYVASKAAKAAKDVADAENRIAGLQARKDAVDNLDIGEDEELDDFERRKAEEKAKYDAEIAEIEAQLPELRRRAEHWNAVRDMAGRTAAERVAAERDARLTGRAESWTAKTGVKVRICRTIDEVDDERAYDALKDGVKVAGWYNSRTGEVGLYLPNIPNEAEIDKTFIHEVVSHKGLRELLGKENYNILCDKVWDQLMTEEERQKYLAYNADLENMTEEEARRAAADEWIAALAENLDVEANRSLFEKLVDFVKEFLDNLLADGVKITREDLKTLMKSSLARYVSETQDGKDSIFLKRQIEAGVGGSVQVSEDGKNSSRLSVRSIATGAGLVGVASDMEGNVVFTTADGRTFDAKHPVTARDLKDMTDSALSYMIKDARTLGTITRRQENVIWQAYADQLNAFLAKGVSGNGITGFQKLTETWEWEVANTVYKSVATNGDQQYLKSIDITRVCKKNEAVIKAISEMQNRLGYGITPGQILDIYVSGIEEGYQVPCPVCYVFSHYLNNGKYATIAVRGQKKYGQFLVDPSTLSEEEKKAKVQEWLDRLRDEEEYNETNKAKLEKARTDLSDIEERINSISKTLTSGKVSEEQRTALMEEAAELDAQYRAALDLYSESGLARWIKQFAIREVTDKDAPKVMGEDGKMHSQKKWVLWEDTFQGFPEQYALDLRLTAETIEKYPAIQRLRNSGGSAAGKEIHFASNNDLGDIPMMLGASNPSDAKNYYKMAAEAELPKDREKYLKLATEKFQAARKYAQQQSLRGGQRMWSWSDNIERLAPDVFVNLLQLQLLGGALQSYSKQLEGVNLVASMGGYVNGSLMGYGKGWREVTPEEYDPVEGGGLVKGTLKEDIMDTVTEKDENGNDVQRERPLTKKGAPVFEVDGRMVTLLFDDVVGIDPYGRDGKKGLFDLNGELDKAGNIIVGMNDTHVIASMADPRVFFIIPWHASGNSTHVVMQMLGFLGAETTLQDLTDYTKVQEEKDALQLDKSGKEKKIAKNTIDIWEKFKDEKKYKVGIKAGTIESGKDGYLSEGQRHYRKLRDMIFAGTIDDLPDALAEVKADAFLSQVYRHVKNDVAAGEMTPNDMKFIYPYEYWNETKDSTVDNADENGFRYLEYCRRLGHTPKFTGGYVKKTDTHYGNFAGLPGYWKLLIDRRMYGVDGRYQGLTAVTTEGYDPKLVDPQWTGENFHVTRVADDPGVDRMVDRAVAMEEENFPNGVPTVDYDLDREEAVARYDEAVAAAEEGAKRREAARKSRAARKPKADKEASGTKLRVRTEEPPTKTVPVYKLMRLGQDGKLYPLFIDSATPTELKTWYDADSPALKDVENLPSDTYTGRRAIKDENDNTVGYEEYKYATYLVDNETGEAMPIAEFKQKYKDGRKYSQMKGNPNVAAVDWASQNGKRWIRVEEKKTAQKRYGGSNKSYYNYGINGSGSVSTFAMRPGWHAGSLPTMRQIGKGAGKNLRDDSFVWVKGYVAADVDYNEEAQGNPDKDIPTHIPTNGFYMKATNANATASQADRVGWYVAGSFMADEIIGDEEAKRIIDEWNAEHPDAKVEYDYPRESGKVFNAETMQLEDAPAEKKSTKKQKNSDTGTRFRKANESQNGFISNAEASLDRIKMEKATPEQWVKMLEKEGGLKAGEDKWLGLSDWLKSQDKKSLTKQEIADYIAENRIQIEEQHYHDSTIEENDLDKEIPGFSSAFGIDVSDDDASVWVKDEDKARELYERETGKSADSIEEWELQEFGFNLASDSRGKNAPRIINGVRLGYTTKGLDNKREIALTVPTIEPWNQGDDIHFGDAGEGRAVAWSRFGDAVDESGNRVLVIDEIQSKRHQEGREKGYASDELKKLEKEYDEFVEETAKKHNVEVDALDDVATPEEKQRAKEFNDRISELRKQGGVPAAPFEKNWHELAMKRMLRLAAEEGYDYVAWTTGDQQAERYNISKAVDDIRWRDAHRGKVVDINLSNEASYTALIDDGGNILEEFPGVSHISGMVGKNIGELVGKENAVKIVSSNDGKIDGENLKVGGEGMKGFYDDILPRFMNKYGKKWGIKVSDITLPNVEEAGRVMHAVPVTQEMKESVMQGQTMFRITPEQDKEYMDAVNSGDMEKAGQMVRDAFKAAFPNTKVVDENGEPKVMYHASGSEGFNVFDKEKIRAYETDAVYNGFWFSSDENTLPAWVRKRSLFSVFLDIENPILDRDADKIYDYVRERLSDEEGQYPGARSDQDAVRSELQKRGYDGVMHVYPPTLNEDELEKEGKTVIILANGLKYLIRRGDEYKYEAYRYRYSSTDGYYEDEYSGGYDSIDEIKKDPYFFGEQVWVAFEPNQIKLADPVTYDDNGNVIPLSERFNRKNNDIRFRVAPTEFEQKEARVSAAEREVTEKTVGKIGEAIGVKTSGVSRNAMPKGHETDKGYYNPKTGELSVCMDNVADEREAVATVIHETVGHTGLQGLLGDRFSGVMAGIYSELDEDGLAWVNGYIVRNNLQPGDPAIAAGIEEYLSIAAERNDSGALGGVSDILGETIDSLFGTDGFALTDRELAYTLRASFEHMKNPGWLDTPVGRAKDTVMKREYGINETDPNKPTDPDGPDMGTRFRVAGTASEEYEDAMDSRKVAAVTENQNADLPVKIGMERVMKEIGKQKLEEEEDYLTRHNLASSRAETEFHDFMLFHFTPMLEQVREIQAILLNGKRSNKTNRKKAYKRIMDYLYAMSGLERNAWKRAEAEKDKKAALDDLKAEYDKERGDINADSRMTPEEKAAALDDAEKRYTKDRETINKKYAPRDYSGITALMGRKADEWQEAEDDARAMISDFKAAVGNDKALDELWDRIRSCTDFNLEHAYRYGLLTREEFERLRGTDTQPRMWDYYLPLRGFSEETAEDIYDYSFIVGSSSSDTVGKKAKGRKTKADNPLANILHIAETEVVQGNDNWAKQALYRFTLNAGENSLLSEVKPWYEKDSVTKKWVMAQPLDVDPATGQPETLEHFNERMASMRRKDPSSVRTRRNGLNLDVVMANKAHRNQHVIKLKVGGVDKMIWVNGNPAMASAVSGAGVSRSALNKLFRSAGRVVSNLFTTYSLDFSVKNLIRDTIYSRVSLAMREDKEYRKRFAKNWRKNFGYGAFAFPMIRLAKMWDSGELQQKTDLTEREQAFIDFMHDGGQTGYTVIQSVERIKSDIEKTMRRAGKDASPVTVPIIGHIGRLIATLNEGFELLTRFTAYQTSRDLGRSGQRAAADAKEISVNFNRKGAQSGNGVWGNIASYLGATHYFYNAGVQGFDNFLRLFKANPVKMSVTAAAFPVMGALVPLLNSMLAGIGGGDDDWYWELPEWVRRNNIIIGTGSWYLAIPLPVEFRALYGIGDIAAAAFGYKKYPNRTFDRVAFDLVSTASGILPVNPVEGLTENGNLGDAIIRTVAPDVGMFFVDWATNRDYTGRALAKENPFSDTTPRSQGVYSSTPKGIVWACQELAKVTGGKVDFAPGVVRDLLNSYGGGYYRLVEDVSKSITGLIGDDPDRPFRYDNIPFFSGFTGHIDEDRSNSFETSALQDYGELSDSNVKDMNAILNTKKITSSIAYDDPDAVLDMAESTVEKARIQKIIGSKDYEIGKEYRTWMNNQYKWKQKSDGTWYKSKEIEHYGVDALRKQWKDLLEEYAKMPGKTEEEKSAKELKRVEVEEAWHRFRNAQGDLVERLMKIEYGE